VWVCTHQSQRRSLQADKLQQQGQADAAGCITLEAQEQARLREPHDSGGADVRVCQGPPASLQGTSAHGSSRQEQSPTNKQTQLQHDWVCTSH
jgi:hypothetical protein